MKRTLYLPGPLPTLNDILRKKGNMGRGKGKRWNSYADLKRSWGEIIGNLAKAQNFGGVPVPAAFTFIHYEPHMNRDPDNFTGGVSKLVLDALQHAKLIDGDGWAHVKGLTHYWTVDEEEPGIVLVVGQESLDRMRAFAAAKGTRKRFFEALQGALT